MQKSLFRWIAVLSGCAGLLAGVATAAESTYPDRPITLLIPYPPGGSADMLGRPLSAALQERLGQPVVLEYKPGAGGSIATAQLARAKPDGHTVLMVLAAHAINPSLYKSLPYDTRKDFAPVSLAATLPMLVAAPLSTPANNIPELIAYARKNPGKLTFASAGPGNTSHLSAEMFKKATGIDMLHVPYKGSGPAVVALLAGEVSLMFDSISTSLPQVQAGKLKALAVTGDTRSPLLPDVPTVQESGVPGFVVNGWYGILAPAGTPPAIVDKLSQAIAESLREPALQQQLIGYGYAPVGSTPEAFGQLIDSELRRWSQAVQDSGASVQ
ncbi:tripartite tricarboxylate transporter substrate binding protein [Bordetella sp. BOR01]|uniref:Bug family tripartite tricarboxylate transporter substrate binding protein n=1 Tax=Bordetella sp. BOR01 TaxID=2854779 RepID=UPI001C43AC82|nr:tripartite tricarboxylate transporter substrate binding protein [Bordetella sp. BOR01]MBV7486740.1 tripartite tricarboxylate transporter substrate binding protein [Bordetella sp. BOR01]